MKKQLLLSLSALVGTAAFAQTVLINESFESYSASVYIAQASPTNWSTWGAAPGTGEDAQVSTAYAHGGLKSLGVIQSVAAGGSTDLLLKLGNKTTGTYTISFWMYIPTGKGGYFNLQTNEDVSPAEWALDMTFLVNGNVRADANGDTATIGGYPHDTWFNVLLIADMDAGNGNVLINSSVAGAWTFATQVDGTACMNQLGSIDFFAYAGATGLNGEYYIDDLSYIAIPVGIEESSGADLLTFPNPAGDQLFVDVPGSAVNPIAQLFDATGRMVVTSSAYSGVGEALRMEMDLRNVPNGVYTLRVNTGGVMLSRKIVKS